MSMRVVNFKGTFNTEVLKFKPVEADEAVVTVDGFFDFDNNNVTKVEVRVEGASIDSESDSVSYASNELTIEFNDLDAPEGDYVPVILVYVEGREEPKILSGPGMKDFIMLELVDLPKLAT